MITVFSCKQERYFLVHVCKVKAIPEGDRFHLTLLDIGGEIIWDRDRTIVATHRKVLNLSASSHT